MSFVDLNNNGSGGQRLGVAPLSYSNSLAERPGARPTGSLITSSNAYGNNSNLNQLSDQLKLFQKQFSALKDRITEVKRRKVGQYEKSELEGQLRDLRESESRLKNQIDHQISLLENMPRTDAATLRATLGKLQKDFERIKAQIISISNDVSILRVTKDIDPSGTSSYGGLIITPSSDGQPQQLQPQQQQQVVLKPLMQEQDVDQMIIEERERDIKKLNHDIALVNEMFKDMAEIVETQGGKIDEIHTATEVSHERAKAGLEQVKQAAAYQNSCLIS